MEPRKNFRPAWAMLAAATAAACPALAQDVASLPGVSLQVSALADPSVVATHGGQAPSPQAAPSPQYLPPAEKATPQAYPPATPPALTPPVPQAAPPTMAVPQAAQMQMMMVPQMASAGASLVQVPSQNVVIQQPELRFFVAQSAPAQTMAAMPMATGNIFLPQAAAPTMGFAAMPMAAPAQPMAAMPMAAAPTMGLAAVPMAAAPVATAAPAALAAAPFAGGTITNQAIGLASSESRSRVEIEAPSRFRNRLANALQSASTRVRGRTRVRTVQETDVSTPQGVTGGGGQVNITSSFATPPPMAQATIPIQPQPQMAPPAPQPPAPCPPQYLPQPPMPTKMPPVVQKTPPVPHKH